MKKLLITLGLVTAFTTSNAGLFKLTTHSRANCINNESVAWWAGAPSNYWLATRSTHVWTPSGSNVPNACQVDMYLTNTWRSAAIHWGEGVPPNHYVVYGYHWIYAGDGCNGDGTPSDTCSLTFLRTYAEDCNIKDG